MEQTILDNSRESLLLNRCRAELNALEYAGVQNINTGVDAVAHELDRLLNETVNLGGMARLVYNDTVLGRLLHLGYDNGTLITVVLVEFSELLEGVVAGDIGVEDEEGRVILAQDVLGELEGTGGAKGFGLDGESDADVVLFLVLHRRLLECFVQSCEASTDGLEGLGHDLRAVVNSKDNIGDTSGSKGLNLVLDHGLVGELDERLGVGEGLQLGVSIAARCFCQRGARKGRGGAERHTKGLRRVPNPPTRMMAASRVSCEWVEHN